MQLSEQCISIEQAKKLKELWFMEPSLYTRVEGGKLGEDMQSEIHLTEIAFNRIGLANCAYNQYLAYTVSELMDILPTYIEQDKMKYFLDVEKQTRYDDVVEYYVWYNNEDSMPLCDELNPNLAQALGDMLIYLLDNKLLDTNTKQDEQP